LVLSGLSRSEKLIGKLLSFPTEMRFSEVKKILEWHGYVEDNSEGSHHVFRKAGAPRIDIPKKGGQTVKRVYLKLLAEKLRLEE
jgi:predicted RNA binding protein YcfA (HicA-like mRNA interferase family)